MERNLILIFGIINVVMLLPFIYYFGKTKIYEYFKNATFYIVKGFGFLITLFADIGGGKTSGQSAMTHAFTVDIQMKINDSMMNVKKIFKSLDFNAIDEYLLIFFENHDEFVINDLVSALIDDFNIQQNIIFDFLSFKPTFDHFKAYVEGFYVLYIRNNYVYSVTNIYSRITGKFNMTFDLNWQNIYQAFEKGNYGIQNYAVELIDEASDHLSAAFWHEFDKDESGAKEYRRKYRHIHEETNRMIDTRQDASDMVKRFRTLTQTHLEMHGAHFINTYHGLYKLYAAFHKTNMSLYKLFKITIPFIFYRIPKLRIGVSYRDYHDHKYAAINYLRNQDNKLLYAEWLIKSFGLVKFEAWKFHSYEDIGKSNPELHDELKLYFPVSWAFGTYEQFAFKGIQKQLLQIMKTKDDEVNIFFEPNFFERVVKSNQEGVEDIDF